MISVKLNFYEKNDILQSHVLFSFTWCRNGPIPLNPKELFCVYDTIIKQKKKTLISLSMYENIIMNMRFLFLKSFFTKLQSSTNYNCSLIT